MLRLFPLLLLPVILYNLIALGGGLFSATAIHDMTQHAITITMFSGDKWLFSFGDFLVLLTLVLLFVEIVKSTRSSSRQIVNHGLSMVTFIIALVEFVAVKNFGTTPFFFIVVMCLFDVVAGYTISIVSAEHDLGLNRPRVE
jgi:ABC-type Na+ efflux pump permease subunit